MPDEPKVGADQPGGGDPPVEGKTFTQEEVNQMIGRRVAETRAQFDDYETLKARAGVADQLERDKLSESEKKDLEIGKLQRENADVRAQATDTLVTAAIQTNAVKVGIVDPEAAVALIDRTGISVAEGVVNGVDDALKTLIETKPYLKGPGPQAPVITPGGTPAPPVVSLTPEQRRAAGAMGVSENAYAKQLGRSQHGPPNN